MLGKAKSIIYTLLLKINHPSINTKGLSTILPRTEIIIRNRGTITIGRDVSTQRRVTLSSVGGHIKVGNNVSFNRNVIIVCHESIFIGDNCILGPNILIYDHDHKFNFHDISRDTFNTSPVIIDRNCWIGANVTILRDTHIGEGCIIGAGTVIQGNIPPHTIVKSDRELDIQFLKNYM